MTSSDSSIAIEAMSVFNILMHPSKRIVNVVLYNANTECTMPHMHHYMKFIEDLARERGCESIYFHGRAGWLKYVKPFGFNEIYRVVEKRL